MQEALVSRDILKLEPASPIGGTGKTVLEAARELSRVIQGLSAKAGLDSDQFYSWLQRAKAEMAGIAVFGGPFHSSGAPKLELMLAFVDQPQYYDYVAAKRPTPAIVDTRICPYLLSSAGDRMLRTPQSFFDAYFASELILLRGRGFRFQKLIHERREIFKANASDILTELVAHRVFHEICGEKGLLSQRHERSGLARATLPKGSDDKLFFLSKVASEGEVSQKVSKNLEALRVENDMALIVARRMALGLQRHSAPHLRSVRVAPPLRKAISGSGRGR